MPITGIADQEAIGHTLTVKLVSTGKQSNVKESLKDFALSMPEENARDAVITKAWLLWISITSILNPKISAFLDVWDAEVFLRRRKLS